MGTKGIKSNLSREDRGKCREEEREESQYKVKRREKIIRMNAVSILAEDCYMIVVKISLNVEQECLMVILQHETGRNCQGLNAVRTSKKNDEKANTVKGKCAVSWKRNAE